MGRIRTIKPEFFRSRSLARVSLPARLTFQGLWCEADDHGRGIADAHIIKGVVWPLEHDITADDVANHLNELERTGHIRRYTVDGDAFYEVVAWEKHQSAAYRRGAAVHPAPPEGPPEQPLHDEACKKVQVAREDVLEGKGREQGTGNGEAPPEASQPLHGRLSEPRHFIELVEPSGSVAVRREAHAIIEEAERLGGQRMLPKERSQLVETVKDALRAEYDPQELAEAIAGSPYKTPNGVMAELRKRKQQPQQRRSVGDTGLSAAAQWVQRQEGA